MTSQSSRRTTRLHKTLSSDNMFLQHSGAVSAFGQRPRPLDTPPQTLQAKRRSIGRAAKAIAGIGSVEEAQAIAMANAQASLAAGKAVNTASLVSANDAAVPDKQSVEYFRASRDASIVTTPLLHGVKNEIVLASYGGNNTYSFITDFEGLTPTESMGDSITLLDAEGNAAAYMNVEEVRDAAGKASLYNRIDIAPYGDGGQYIVTVTLDKAFLTAPDTVYPVAAATTSQATIGSAKINDADVNSGSPSTNYGSSSTMWVGYINGAKYRSYVQFCIEPYESYIAPYGISDAYLLLYEKSGNTSTFTMQPRIPDNIWNYTSLTWNNQPGYLSAFNGVNAPPNVQLTQTSTMYRVYMTAFVQACMRNYVDDSAPKTIHEQRGLMLKIANESSAQVRMFNSTNASSNKPTLVVTYRPSHYGGGAGVYWNCTSAVPNCAGYAVHKNYNINLSVFANGSGVEMPIREYVNAIIDKYSSQGIAVEWEDENANQDGYISGNRYRIAIRTSLLSDNSMYCQNYHVVVQLRDGSWAGKMKTDPSRWLGLINVYTDSSEENWSGALNNPNVSTRKTLLFQVTGIYN